MSHLCSAMWSPMMFMVLVVVLLSFLSGHCVHGVSLPDKESDTDVFRFPERPDGYEPRFVAILTRHGDRTPVKTYPNMRQVYPVELGQLTSLGMQQHYALGQRMRELYMNEYPLISPHYSVNEVFLRSTARDRTLASAYSFAAGMFPPGTGPNITGTAEPALPHAMQAVSIYSEAKSKDYLIYAYKNCPTLKRMTKAFKKGDEYTAVKERHASFAREISSIVGASDLGIGGMRAVLAVIRYEHNHPNDPSPEKQKVTSAFTREQEETIIDISRWCFTRKFPHREAGKLAGGNLLREVRRRMSLHKGKGHQDGNPNRKVTKKNVAKAFKSGMERFMLLSGHDGTIAAVISALGWTKYLPPQYASHILFELMDGPEGWKVRVIYDDDETHTNGVHKQIVLDWSEWVALVEESSLPSLDAWKQACAGNVEQAKQELRNEEAASVPRSVVFVGALLVGALGLFVRERARNQALKKTS